MTHILLVLCGGTICTAVKKTEKGVFRSIDQNADVLLTKNYYASDSAFKEEVQFTSSRNFEILSENMTIDKWNVLIDYFRGVSVRDYDGIIIAHGTDTLAYSAALFSLVLAGMGKPVFFVSSNEPLSSPTANGNINFQKAVECICMGIGSNVYAVYRNPSSGRVLLHLGSRLMQCGNYSEDFYSQGSEDITDLSAEKCQRLFSDVSISCPVELSGNRGWKLRSCVLKIDPYVGLNYEAFRYDGYDAILHGAYHSGTACTEQTEKNRAYSAQSILRLLDLCGEEKDVYISPAKNEGEIYDSVGIMARHGGGKIRFLYGCTNEMSYVKLLLAYSLHVDDVETFMRTQYNGEMIDQ